MNFGLNLWNKVFCRMFGLIVMLIMTLSGHPWLIIRWWSKRKTLSNDRNSKLHIVIWQKNCFSWILSACSSGLRFSKNLQINLEAKSMHGSSWNFFSIISVFILVCAGQVLFSVNGLNWSQCWLVLVCLLRKSLNHWNTN